MDDEYIRQSTQEQNDAIHQRLREYNRRYMHNFRDYSCHVEKDGQMIAGIVAASTFDTLEVEFLFVDEAQRGKGLGSRLLRHVEALAARDGVKHVLLNTYSFQAPAFYTSMGYTQLFEINPCLGEYGQHFFWKELDNE